MEVGVAGACGNYRGAIYVDPRIEDALPTTDLPENVATRHVRMCGVAVAPDLKAKTTIVLSLLTLSIRELSLAHSIVKKQKRKRRRRWSLMR